MFEQEIISLELYTHTKKVFLRSRVVYFRKYLPRKPELRKDKGIRPATSCVVDQCDACVDALADVERDACVVVVEERQRPVGRRRTDEGDGQVGGCVVDGAVVANGRRDSDNAMEGGQSHNPALGEEHVVGRERVTKYLKVCGLFIVF